MTGILQIPQCRVGSKGRWLQKHTQQRMLAKLPSSGYSVQFSPFHPDKVAVASAQNFGIVGTGRQAVFEVGTNVSKQKEAVVALDFEE